MALHNQLSIDALALAQVGFPCAHQPSADCSLARDALAGDNIAMAIAPEV